MSWFTRASITFCVWVCVFFCDFSGNTPDSAGTAFVVYEDMFNAQNASERLKGTKVGDQYLLILYYRNKVSQRVDVDKLKKKREKLGKIRPKLILSDD